MPTTKELTDKFSEVFKGKAKHHGLNYFTIELENKTIGFFASAQDDSLTLNSPLVNFKDGNYSREKELRSRTRQLTEEVAKSIGISKVIYESIFVEDKFEAIKEGYSFEPGMVGVKVLN